MVFNMLRLLLLFVLILPACASSTKKSTRAHLHYQVGDSALQEGNYAVAIKEFLAAESYDNKDPFIQNGLGLAYMMRQKYSLAETRFKKSLSLDPRFTEAKNNLARLYIEQNYTDSAIKLLGEVLADLTYPNAPKAHYHMGLAYFKKNNFNEAKLYFLRTIEVERTNCSAQTYYGRTLLELKENGRAANALDKAASFCKSNNFDDPIYYSALAYYRLGDSAKAKERLASLKTKEGPFKEKARDMYNIIEQR